MAKTYRDMGRINELALELKQELAKFEQWMVNDINYNDHLYMQDVVVGGYIDEFGDDASEQVIQADLDDAYEQAQSYANTYHPELKTIGRITPLLNELLGIG